MKGSTLRRLNALVYPYRFDLLAFLLLGTVLTWFYSPLFAPGHIVFSDIDFPADGRRYLEQVSGLWNQRFNSPTMLNLPRLLYLLPAWLVSAAFQGDGSVLLKAFLVELITVSALSFYLFGKRLFSVYLETRFDLTKTLVLAAGAFFYVTNPWFVIRIQHIYLLCGYSLLPLMLLFFFNAFDPRFQTQLISRFSLFRIRPYRQNVFDLAALALTISLMSAAIHYFFYSLIILTVLGGLLVAKQLWLLRRSQGYLRRAYLLNIMGKLGLLGTFLSLFCAYWLATYAGSLLGGMAVSQNNINVDDTLSLFSRHSDLAKVATLISYWWPMMDLDHLGWGFWAGAVVLGGFLILGLAATLRFPAVLFFTLMTLLFLVASTGTTWEVLAPWFIGFVTQVPVFGSLFRDPNKLMGLAALGYALLLIFGLAAAARSFPRQPTFRAFFLAFGGIVLSLAAWSYLEPFHRHYLSGFYAPVPVPAEYAALNQDLEGGPRTLVLPVAEAMTRPDTGVATPLWNQNPDPEGPLKATGDFTIYNSQTNGLFHHEGNDPGIAHAFWFLDDLLNRGLTDRIGEVFRPWGTPRLVYQTGYSGQESRQAFHQKLLALDKSLVPGPASPLFRIFGTGENPPAAAQGFEVVPQAVFTTQGLARAVTFRNLASQTGGPGGVFYASAGTNQVISRLRTGDRLEYTTFDDLWLTSLPETSYVRVAKGVTDGNAYLGWAQSSAHTTDWQWYLESLGLTHHNYEQDLGAGLAVTFAPARLDVPVYRRNGIRGDTFMDFNAMLRLNLFFRPDNPDSFEVQASPQGTGNDLPTVAGVIQAGETLENWQVAKSGLIDAREKTPYQFRIKVSGRGTNQIHFKIRFFDKDRNQLGITYVVSPAEKMNFDGVAFYGEYVSPEASRFMRIELLSYQRPEQKVFWWIHDLLIQDLGAYAAPNTLHAAAAVTPGNPTKVWLRVLRSPAGGKLVVRALGKPEAWTIDTKDARRTWFEWVEAGTFVPGSPRQEFQIDNRSGFNAVNLLVALAVKDLPRLQAPIQEAVRRSSPFLALEAETDFSYEGSLQSTRTYPSLSLGSAIRGVDVVLHRTIEVPREGPYRFTLNVGGPPQTTTIQVDLRRRADGERRTWVLPLGPPAGDTAPRWVVDDLPALDRGKEYLRTLKSLTGELPGYQQVRSPWWNLKDGLWDLDIRLTTAEPPLSTTADLHPFDPSTVRDPAFAPETPQADCSDCETLEPWMMKEVPKASSLILRYQPTCSCDWYIESSQRLAVKPEEELLIQFEARSEFLRERHTKVVWLGPEGQIVGNTFVPEVEEPRKVVWNRYEMVARVPLGAVSALFQIWGRGDKKRTAEFEIRNYRIYSMAKLPLVDTVVWEHGGPDPRQAGAALEVWPDGTGGYRLHVTAGSATTTRLLVAGPMTSSPIWRAYQDGSARPAEPGFNGVRSAFWLETRADGSADAEVRIPLTGFYLACLAGIPLGLLATVLLYQAAKHPLPLRRRFRRRSRHTSP